MIEGCGPGYINELLETKSESLRSYLFCQSIKESWSLNICILWDYLLIDLVWGLNIIIIQSCRRFDKLDLIFLIISTAISSATGKIRAIFYKKIMLKWNFFLDVSLSIFLFALLSYYSWWTPAPLTVKIYIILWIHLRSSFVEF